MIVRRSRQPASSPQRNYLVAPEVETTNIGLTTEKINVVLPNKIVRRVDDVSMNNGIAQTCEHCISLVANQREGSALGTEVIVQYCRRDCIEALRVDIVENGSCRLLSVITFADCAAGQTSLSHPPSGAPSGAVTLPLIEAGVAVGALGSSAHHKRRDRWQFLHRWSW